MCELLGMSANVPTDICFSFSSLKQRGGKCGPHKDGWGITFYEGRGCRTFKDTCPCYSSSIASMLQGHPIKSNSVIGHIRQANCGQVSLENTHPFTRQLWGRNWTFAHNGQLKEYYSLLNNGYFEPVGQTDSEYAFCWLLSQLKQHYGQKPDNVLDLFQFIASGAKQLSQYGVFNMLLSDGYYLMAYNTTNLYWITRRAPFGTVKMADEDVDIDFVKHTTPKDVVTIFATQPLTCNEQWQKIPHQQFVLFYLGERVL